MEDTRKKKLGYSVVAASWLAVFCLFGYRSTFSILLQPISQALDKTASEISLAYSLMMVLYAVTAYFSGMILDKWGARPAFAIGSVFAALGFIVSARAQSYLGFLIPYAVFAGIGTGMLWVTSTMAIRRWYVGKSYGTMWGFAFMGAPIAQVLMSLGVKKILVTMDWRTAMTYMGFVVFVALIIAALIAKKNPEDYDYEPFGIVKDTSGAHPKEEYVWGVKEAFKKFAIWGAILAFLGSMMGEFLIWTQIVSYWTIDAGMDISAATNLYVTIGIVGIFTMPLMGKISDLVVEKIGNEPKGRKIMLIFAPATGVIACILLLLSKKSVMLGVIACVLFAVYWAIEPGGVAGYAGAMYGRKSIGKIWGLATLIVMGIGPALGTFMGGYLFDLSGTYQNSILFAIGAFIFSILIAAILPLTIKTPNEELETPNETYNTANEA